MATAFTVLLLALGSHSIGGYGLRVDLPPGWHGRVSQGVVAAATFPIPAGDTGFGPATARLVVRTDVLLLLSEYEPLHGEHLLCRSRLRAPSLRMSDLRNAQRRPRLALANFCVGGRHFTLFGQAGKSAITRGVLSQVNHVLGSFTARRGDFYPGTVPPARFPDRPGWHIGSSGPSPIQPQGEQTEVYAATVPYGNGPNDLPPVKTVQRLGRDDILIWLGLYRDSRRPPPAFADETAAPLRIDPGGIFTNWEGNANYGRDGLYRQTSFRRGQYDLDLWVFFGSAHPSRPVVTRAQAMLDSVKLPRWPPPR